MATLTREYVQANLGKLAPLNKPDKFCKWWWEFHSGGGHSAHAAYGSGRSYFYGSRNQHYGPMSRCEKCWQARLEEYIRLGGNDARQA